MIFPLKKSVKTCQSRMKEIGNITKIIQLFCFFSKVCYNMITEKIVLRLLTFIIEVS